MEWKLKLKLKDKRAIWAINEILLREKKKWNSEKVKKREKRKEKREKRKEKREKRTKLKD
jgi:hypothetical protein